MSTLYASLRFGISLSWGSFSNALTPLQWIAYILIFAPVVKLYNSSFSNLFMILVITTLIVTGIGFLQYYDMLGVRGFLDRYYPKLNIEETQFSTSNLRITSTFEGNPNILATFLTFAIILIVVYIIVMGSNGKRGLAYATLGLASVSMVLTGSRAQLFASLAALFVLSVIFRNQLFLLTCLGVGLYFRYVPEVYVQRWQQIQVDPVFGEVVLGGSLGKRVDKARDLWDIFTRSPILGVGPTGYFGTTTDNFYLRTLVDAGTLGLFLNILLWLIIGLVSWRIYQKIKVEWQRAIAIGLFAFLIAMAVGNIGARILSMPRISEAFWVLVVLVYSFIPSRKVDSANTDRFL
jgi:hypothetical protein